MNKQAQVGIFAILGVVAVFLVFFVLSDFATRSRGYKIGVHFRTASGLRPGAQVYLSGVPVGAVDHIELLPDFSTDVILSILKSYSIPVDSKFLIQAPITGEPTLLIQPPRGIGANAATLAREIVPIDQQAQGTNPASIADLLEQGQGEVKRLDSMLSQLQTAEPRLLAELQSTLHNANELTQNANVSLTNISGKIDHLSDALTGNLTTASRNVADLTGTLNASATRDAPKVDALLAQLQTTSKSFNTTVDSLRAVATNPGLKHDLLATTRDFATTAHTFSHIAGDLHNVTGNPATQAQLRDTVANLDRTTRRVDSLLGQLGGTDEPAEARGSLAPAASPPPTSNSVGAPGGIQPPGGTDLGSSYAPARGITRDATATARSAPAVANFKRRLATFTRDLYEFEIRASVLTPLRPGSYDRNVSPYLSSDRGPQSDVNLYLLPYSSTGAKLGFNDIGYGQRSSANFVLLKRNGPVTFGGGVEYSQLGAQASVAGRILGVEARAYDLRHPTLDTYLNFFALRKGQLFVGERDITHASRRSTAGLQFEF